MYCTKCGKKADLGAKFCANCGNKLKGGNAGESKPKHTNLNKTFSDHSLLMSNPKGLCQEINNWLAAHPNIFHVRINFHMSKGVVRSITLDCKEGSQPNKEKFHVDVDAINIGGIFGLFAKKPDHYIQKWKEEHPDRELVFEKPVYDYNNLKEVWFLYKVKK